MPGKCPFNSPPVNWWGESWHFYFQIVFLFCFLAFAFPAYADTTVSDSLYQVAQGAYDEGNFDGAEFAALRGLQQAQAEDDLYRLKFHLLLGFVYVARDQNGFETPLIVSFYGFDAYRLPASWGSDMFRALFRKASAVISLGPAMDQQLIALGCPGRLMMRARKHFFLQTEFISRG